MRDDMHRPSVIEPEDYQFVGYECLKTDAYDVGIVAAYREQIRKHMENTGGKYSTHAHGGSCHICGAHAIYIACFYHWPTNTYIRTGLDCAEKLELKNPEDFRVKVHKGLEAIAGKKKALALFEQYQIDKAWQYYTAEYNQDWKYEETTIREIVWGVVKYGNISEKQVAFVKRLLEKIENRAAIEAQREAEKQEAKEIPNFEDRVEIEGEVVSVKYDEFYGYRILIKHADGWKVFGTRPKGIADCERGDKVKFQARIIKSDKDPKFGFFSRPTQAKRI